MFLDEIAEPTILMEMAKKPEGGFGHKLYFDYQKAKEMSKPNPIVLFLGVWRMTDKSGTRKKFLCGINLAALSSKEELSALQYYMPDILEPKNMKARYKVGKMLLPDIFRKGYRTYNVKNISSRPIFGRLYALKPTDQDIEDAQKSSVQDGRVWDDLKQREKDEYVEKAMRTRGEKDVGRKDRARAERDKIGDYMSHLQTQKDKEDLEPEKPADISARRAVSRGIEPEFAPIEPGPGIDYKPKAILQSPIKTAETGMPAPERVKVKLPAPEEKEGEPGA